MRVNKKTGKIELTPEELHKTKTESFNDGADHNKYASKEAKETFKIMSDEITKIKINMTELQGEVKLTNQKVDNVGKNVEGLHTKMNNFIKSADDCYARKDNLKRLENFITKVMWVSVITLIGFLAEVIWFFTVNYLEKL